MKEESQSTWGKTVSIKFYLNKKLKPAISEGEKRYPLYVRVVCKKQVSDFKVYDGQKFTDSELALALTGKDSRDLQERSAKELLAFVMSYTTSDINTVMDLVHPFDRPDFILKNLPELLRMLHEFVMEIRSSQGLKQIKESLAIHGYGDLIEIIDWKTKYPDVVAHALEELQRNGKIRKFKVWNRYKPELSPGVALMLLSEAILEKAKYPDTARKQKRWISSLVEKKLLHPKELSNAEETLKRAVEFASEAMKLTSK
jgi:hypothetical protein